MYFWSYYSKREILLRHFGSSFVAQCICPHFILNFYIIHNHCLYQYHTVYCIIVLTLVLINKLFCMLIYVFSIWKLSMYHLIREDSYVHSHSLCQHIISTIKSNSKQYSPVCQCFSALIHVCCMRTNIPSSIKEIYSHQWSPVVSGLKYLDQSIWNTFQQNYEQCTK